MKRLLIILPFVLIILLVGAYFILRSQWGLERIRRFGEGRIVSVLGGNGEVRIERIDGNPFNHLALHGVDIQTPDFKTSIKELDLRYNLFKFLFTRELHYSIGNGILETSDFQLTSLQLRGRFSSRMKRMRLNLHKGSGDLQKIGVRGEKVEIKSLTGNIVFNSEGEEGLLNKIEDGMISISTPQSHLKGRVFNSKLFIQNSSLSLEDVNRIFFPSLPMEGSILMEGEYWIERGESRLRGDLQFEEGNIMGFSFSGVRAAVFLEGRFLTMNTEDLPGGTIGVLVNTREDPPYIHFDGELEGMNLSNFLPFYETRLYGNIRGLGRGLRDWKVTFSLGESQLLHLKLSELDGTLEMKDGQLFIPTLMVKKGDSQIELTGDHSNGDPLYNLETREVELSEVLPYFFEALPDLRNLGIHGKFSCDLVTRGFPENPSLFGSFWVRDPQLYNRKASLLSADLQFSSLGRNLTGEGQIGINHFTLMNRNIETLNLQLKSQNGESDYTLKSTSAEETLRVIGTALPLDETFYFHFDTLLFRGKEFMVSNQDPIHVTIQADHFALSTGPIDFMDGTLNLWSSIEGKGRTGESHFVMEGERVHLDRISHLFNLPWDLEGEGKFNFTAQGTIEKPSFDINLQGKDFRLDEIPDHADPPIAFRKVDIDSFSLNLTHNKGELGITRGDLYRGEEKTEITGSIPYDFFSGFSHTGKSNISQKKEMDIHISLNDIGAWIFSPFFETFDVSRGVIDGEIDIEGTLQNPDVEGLIEISSAEVYIPSSSTSLSNGEGLLRLTEDHVTLERVYGLSEGGEGWVETSGKVAIDLIQLKGKSYDIDIRARNIPFEGFTDVYAFVDANISIGGSPETPRIEGDVDILEGVIFREFRSTEEELVTSTFSYDFDITAERNVWLKNSNADIEFKGDVKIRGESGRRILSGVLKAQKGEFFYLDRSFQVSRGELTFSNTPELNPSMDIMAETEIRYKPYGANQMETDTIQLQVLGTLRDPKFDLIAQGDESLSREEMIALLTLNMSLKEFTESGVGGLMSGAGEQGMALLERRLSRELEQSTGLDALFMETQFFGEEMSARFTFGKYLRRDLFVSYSTDIFSMESNRFKAEYYLGKNASLYGQRSGSEKEEDYDLGVQLKYHY
jgi:hypothetical protein